MMVGELRPRVMDLLKQANCQKGQCIQCGQEGHYMNTDRCPLKDKQLVDKPCRICKQGLHSADDCVRMYDLQGKQDQTPQQGAAGNANQVDLDDESLND